jgi:hypothetical protein
MAHQRKTIRDNVITSVTGLTTTGSNVFNTRILPNVESNLPCLNVYTVSESSEEIDFLSIERTLILEIDGYAKHSSTIEDSLDVIAKEVENALATDVSRGNNAYDTFLQSTDIELTDEGDIQMGVVRLQFAIKYRTAKTDSESHI